MNKQVSGINSTGNNFLARISQNKIIIIDLAVLAFIWTVLALIVNPHGEFPLNDDWLYTKSVHIFISEHYIKLMDYISMTLLSNILWGSLFCKLFGFTYLSLRISTLVISYFAIASFFLIVRKSGVERMTSYLISGIIIFNPLFFSQSYTFMTDNFFLAMILLSYYFFVNYLSSKSNISFIATIFFSIVAALSRQLGLFIPLGFALAILINGGLSLRKSAKAFLPFGISFLALIAYYFFLKFYNSVPESSGYHTEIIFKTLANPLKIFKIVSKNILQTAYDIGFFMLPAVPLLTYYLKQEFGKRIKPIVIFTSIVFAPLLVCLIYYSGKVPLFWNSIQAGGIGPITLYGFETQQKMLSISHYAVLPNIFWIIISFFSLLNGAFLVSFCAMLLRDRIRDYKSFKLNKKNVFILFPAISILIYWFIFSLTYFFDRYLLIIVPFLIILIINLLGEIKPRANKITMAMTCFILVFYLLFSVLGTMDYLNWNRVRWQALNDLTIKEGISPLKIDGGYEFNGWYNYQKDFKIDSAKSSLWVHDDEYIVTFGERLGYDINKMYMYQRLMPFQPEFIYVLKRKSGQIH